ncbi:MAG: hypothetical protein DRO11_02210 [Methanobacteriota archaeon]|nr:MAG: hypothetical protein DRO11_02210 [Euryarchaeota archaeon]
MSTITRIPKADGTYSELTPSPNDGVHYTKVRRDDGDSTGVQNGGPGATELIDTFKFSVPTGTTKITVTSKTTNFNLDPGNVQNVLFDGSLSRGALTPVNGWTEVSDEFTGTFSGEI